MKMIARRFGRLLFLNPALPGLIALLLTAPVRSWFIRNFPQPIFGNFYPEQDFHVAVINLFNFFVSFAIPLPVSYFVYKRFTEKLLRPNEYQPRSFTVVWFWVLCLAVPLVVRGPQTYRALVNMKTHAKPVANAEMLALELADLIANQKFAELMKRLPANTPVDQEEIETNLELMAGDKLKLESLKPFAVFGPMDKGRMGKLGTVAYRAGLMGSKNPYQIYVYLEWKEGGWSPLWIDPGYLRMMDPEVKKAAEAYVQILIEGEYQKAWQMLPEDFRMANYELFQKLATENFGTLKKPATPLAVASRSLAKIEPRDAGRQVVIEVKAPNRKLRVHVGMKHEPAGWVPVSIIYSRDITD